MLCFIFIRFANTVQIYMLIVLVLKQEAEETDT